MYATANLQQRYQQQSIVTARPMDLVIMLYEGCIKQCTLAGMHWSEAEQRARHLEKAQDIVLELLGSLNMNYEVSGSLSELYEFMIMEFTRLSIADENTSLSKITQMLTTLKDAWQTVKSEV